MIRIMIDMETTGTDSDAGILTLGAVVFDVPFGYPRPTFYDKASLASNEAAGRKVDKATMEWWNKQDSELRKEVFSGTQSVSDMLSNFIVWCTNQLAPGMSLEKDVQLWSRGAGFDCEILKHACYQLFGHYPFDFRNHMCQRTVEALMPAGLVNLVQNSYASRRKHHALDDAMHQANMMDAALRNIIWGNNLHAY